VKLMNFQGWWIMKTLMMLAMVLGTLLLVACSTPDTGPRTQNEFSEKQIYLSIVKTMCLDLNPSDKVYLKCIIEAGLVSEEAVKNLRLKNDKPEGDVSITLAENKTGIKTVTVVQDNRVKMVKDVFVDQKAPLPPPVGNDCEGRRTIFSSFGYGGMQVARPGC
jgi:hypothetical protein